MDRETNWDMLYEEYARPVYLYLRSLCRDERLAEDLTQETFFRAMKSIHRFNGSCRLVTWLCQIGKHLWYRELEKRKKRCPNTPLEEEALVAPQSVQAQIESDEGRIDLFRALQTLSPGVREVVYLRVMGDLSFRQIGEVLGESENWARVNFYRAKEKLRKGWPTT